MKLFDRFNSAESKEKINILLSKNRHQRKKLINKLSDYEIADILAYSDEADAAACLDILPKPRPDKIIKLLRSEKREKIRLLLSFAPYTAGRLVDSNFIEVKLTTPKTLIEKKVRAHYLKNNKPPIIIVEDSKNKIIGRLPIEVFLLDDWQTPQTLSPASKKNVLAIAAARIKPLPAVPYNLDQEHLIDKAVKTSAKMLAVVDNEKNRVLGIIETEDLIKVLQYETTEDFYRFAGLPPEEHISDSPLRAVKLRYKWLIVNLFTVLVAAVVVSFFKDTLRQVVILAAFMPVVAGMGGNAGTQTLAVMVRGIAANEINMRTTRQVVLKELAAGLLNGVITGVIIGIIAFFWQGSFYLGFVLFLSMIVNLFVAGLFGALVPISLRALRIDPAVASSIFITTATDVFGFLTFLSLADWLLL